MAFHDKLDRAAHELETVKIWDEGFRPPVYDFLWKAGIQLRPPHYASYLFNIFVNGSLFSIFFAIALYVLSKLRETQGTEYLIQKAVIGGFVFGVFLAISYKKTARKHNLSKWSDL